MRLVPHIAPVPHEIPILQAKVAGEYFLFQLYTIERQIADVMVCGTGDYTATPQISDCVEVCRTSAR